MRYKNRAGTKKQELVKANMEQLVIENNEQVKSKSKLIGVLIAIVAIIICVTCFSNKNVPVDSDASESIQYAKEGEIKTPENTNNSIEIQTPVEESKETFSEVETVEEVDVTSSESEAVEDVRLGWYSNRESNPSLGTLMQYVDNMLKGNIDKMLYMIADEEYLLTVQNMPSAITSFKEYYTHLYEEQVEYLDEYISATQFDRCYVADREMFLDFVGITEEEVLAEYLDDYEWYYVYTGVCYVWINMQTDDMTEYRPLTPSDSVIIGEKNGEFELLVVMSDFYDM